MFGDYFTLGKCFHGDSNDSLMEIQKYYYNELAFYFYIYAKERYEKATRLVGVETDLYRKIKDIELSDVYIFTEPYKLLAANYRFYYSNELNRKLHFSKKDFDVILSNEWTSFFHEKLKGMVQFDNITLTILEVVIYQHYTYKDDLLKKLISILEDYC